LSGEHESYQTETRFKHKDGWYVWVLASISAVRDAENEPVFLIAQFQDITARREMERVKSEFVSVVSHELRTPLTSIHGALGLVVGTMTDKMPPAATRLLTIAQKNSERLTVLINDMLDIDKIATGNLRFDFAEVDVGRLLREAVDINQSYAEEHGVTIVPVGEIPAMQLRVDASRMQQILGNLLSNACKFSPVGGAVEISCMLRPGGVRFLVADQGPGIDTAFKARIFERFSQADSSSSRGKSGTGLGLYISRKLIEAMNGKIGFESHPGEGSTFWVDLPGVTTVAENMLHSKPGELGYVG
jgi:signal transduction histidine kinase